MATFERVRTLTDRVAIDIRLTGTRFEPGPLPVDTIEIDTRLTLEIARQRREAEVNVGQLAVAIRNLHGHDMGSIVGQLDAAAILIRAGKERRSLTLVVRSE